MNPFADCVRYHLYEGEPLPPVSASYDYVLAGNGLFIRAKSPFMEVCWPLATVNVALLPHLKPFVTLPCGRLNGAILEHLYVDAERLARRQLEQLYYVLFDDNRRRWTVIRPPQIATAGRCIDPNPSRYPNIFCEIHSHHRMPAFWSETDNADEQGFRFYAVLGGLLSKPPEMRLRLGVAGHQLDLPVTTLFTHSGPFTDLHPGNLNADTRVSQRSFGSLTG